MCCIPTLEMSQDSLLQGIQAPEHPEIFAGTSCLDWKTLPALCCGMGSQGIPLQEGQSCLDQS